MSVGGRLKQYMEFKGVKRADFAESNDIPYNSLTSILNSKRNMSSEVMEKIFTYFPELNARWFLTGKGPMEYTVSSYFLDKEKEASAIEGEPEYDGKQLLQEFIQDDVVLNVFHNLLNKNIRK